MGAALGHRIRVHALKAGTWPAHPQDVTFTAADLAATAAAYDPAKYQAPVVIGHPDTDDPAWGWIDSAEFGDNGLYVQAGITDEMAQLVKERRYQTVSLRLWGPTGTGNPTPGVWSIRHLGFLGAVPPAVKGLDRTVFASQAEGESFDVPITAVSVELSERDDTTPRRSAEPPSTGDLSTETGDEKTMEKEKELEQKGAELAERQTALEGREAAVMKRERELRLAGYGQEVDALVRDGRVLPVEKPGVIALMERLDEAATVCLSETDTDVPAGKVLRDFLKNLPPRVDLKERSAPEGGAAVAQAKAPEGYSLSERGAAIDTRAKQLMAANANLSYIAAVRQAEAEA